MFWSRWFRKKPNLPPLVPPFRDYWLILRVRLTPPLQNVDGGPEMVGYFRVIGVRCESDALRGVLETYVDDGVVLWGDTECNEVDVEKLDGRNIHTISPDGFFFQSGKIYFPRDPADQTDAA